MLYSGYLSRALQNIPRPSGTRAALLPRYMIHRSPKDLTSHAFDTVVIV